MTAPENLPPLSRLAMVDVAEAELDVDWPRNASPTLLRGAVCGEMERALSGRANGGDVLHGDWHNHVSDTETIQQPPRTMYRVVDGRPRLYWWGTRAHEHALLCVKHLHALRFDRENLVVPIRAIRISTTQAKATVAGRRPLVYELVSPFFPAKVSAARRPPDLRSAEARAWASFMIAGSIRMLLPYLGVELDHTYAVDVHLEDLRFTEVRYRGDREVTKGFYATIWTTAELPDGMGIGARRAEGFGELRHLARPVRR